MNLSFCELNQDAGLAVAAAVANKKALKKIDLNGTAVVGVGVHHVVLYRQQLWGEWD